MVNFRKFINKTEINIESCRKCWFFARHAWSLRLACQRQKWWTQLTYQNFRVGWINSYWNISAFRVTINLKPVNESHGSTKLSTSSTWPKSPNHLIKLAKLYTYRLLLSSVQWIVCGGSSETALSKRQIWSETSLAAAEKLVCWLRLTSSKVLLPKKGWPGHPHKIFRFPSSDRPIFGKVKKKKK